MIGSQIDGESRHRDKTETDNSHKVVGFNHNKLVFINPCLNAAMDGQKTDIDTDNRHGPKSGELLCPH